MEISVFEVLIVSFLSPIGAVFWSYFLYKLVSKSIIYRIKSFAADKVLG